MTHILLTGAGFTHNWGGWLASEAFEYLLGCPDVDDVMRRELWADKNEGRGFEDTLGRLQQEAAANPVKAALVDKLSITLGGMFNEMDRGLRRRYLEFQNDFQFQIAPFLVRFDAIFTLNQDVFLERKYQSVMEPLRAQKWAGFASPGLSPLAGADCGNDDTGVVRRYPGNKSGFRVEENIQPYFKLHGSSNWYDTIGRKLLIMGGDKTSAIRGSALLQWYADQFDLYLCRGDARLMIIGYSFSDPHINKSIINGVRRGLRVFIIDPRGTDILDRRKGHDKAKADELMSVVQPAVIGASRRSLRATFGGDIVEHERVKTFFHW